jgi:hypothetical protein
MATALILSHKAENPVTANYHHTMATVIRTHIHKYYQIKTNIP